MKPLIGIVSSLDKEGNSLAYFDYVSAVELSGGVPLVLPYTETEETVMSYTELCDGFLFLGGCDVEPSRYGTEASEFLGETDPRRDSFDFMMIWHLLKKQKPIMAVCRGAQVINIALGGTLIQDIKSEYKTDIIHRQESGKYEYSHDVLIDEGEKLYSLLKKSRITVNSFHHQAVKKLGKGLRTMALSEDGIIEAFRAYDHPYLYAYQWHPERLYAKDKDQLKLFYDFIMTSKVNK